MRLDQLHWEGSVAIIHRAAQPNIYIGRNGERFNVIIFIDGTRTADTLDDPCHCLLCCRE
jgi:hypothetical protein